MKILQHLLHLVQAVAQFQVTKVTISAMMRTTMLDAIRMAVIVVATLTIAIVTLANAWILLSKEVAEFLSTKATTFATMKTIT